MLVIYGHVVYQKGKCNTKGKWFKLKWVQFVNIYMGKGTNQDDCHTTNMKNDRNSKTFFLYGHVVYQNEGNTKGMWLKNN